MASEQSMTLAITHPVIEVTKMAIMVVRKAEGLIESRKPAHAAPRVGGQFRDSQYLIGVNRYVKWVEQFQNWNKKHIHDEQL